MDEEAQRSVSFRLIRKGDWAPQNPRPKGEEAKMLQFRIPHYETKIVLGAQKLNEYV